jgi:ATP-dependent helicase/nuclease subunit B
MTQLAAGLGLAPALGARDDLLFWAREIDKRPREKRAQRPAPRPPVSTRPRQLSVTEIETWLRDPYAIYAKHILRLKPLDPLNAEAGARERGIAVHRVLEKFLRRYPDNLPKDALTELLLLGEEILTGTGASPALLALWRPRLQRALGWFFEFEQERRADIASTAIEAKGEFRVAPSLDFTLRGRADRIDIYKDGSAAILDYKTGRVPSDKQIEELLAPQLPLEAAMLLAGAFPDALASSVRELVHVRLTGGVEEGEVHIFKANADAIAEKARESLARHATRYESPAQPYLSRAIAERTTDEGDYDHLARVAEWSLAEDGE